MAVAFTGFVAWEVVGVVAERSASVIVGAGTRVGDISPMVKTLIMSSMLPATTPAKGIPRTCSSCFAAA